MGDFVGDLTGGVGRGSGMGDKQLVAGHTMRTFIDARALSAEALDFRLAKYAHTLELTSCIDKLHLVKEYS